MSPKRKPRDDREWAQGVRGRKMMKRSIEHRMSKEQGSVSAYAPLKEPPDWHSLPLDHEPCLVQPLLDKGRDSAARVCMCVLQLLIMLVKA